MRHEKEYIVGNKYSRLLVLERLDYFLYGGHRAYKCLCDCGNVKITTKGNLIKGTTSSCGCKRREYIKKAFLTHGDSVDRNITTEFKTWVSIRVRCYLKSSNNYENYGGRGIKVCDRWLMGYKYFLQDMGRKPTPKHSIERIDNNGDYEPSNCRWATVLEQSRNRRSSIILEYNGVIKTQGEWAMELNICTSMIGKRLKIGVPFNEIYNYFKNNYKMRKHNKRIIRK